jgi:deazaflavin-dependent oxidoreductase (nitroreductase family)
MDRLWLRIRDGITIHMINFEQRPPGPLRRLVRNAAEIIPMALVPGRVLPRLDREVFRLTRGRTTFSAWASGLPIVMLTTTGARTGQPRTLPILGLPDGDRLVVIASNFGRPQHPGWYYNLRAHPLAVISWEGSTFEMRARELRGDERQHYLDRSHQTYPWWEEYHRHAAPRQIPVIMLEPLSEPEH